MTDNNIIIVVQLCYRKNGKLYSLLPCESMSKALTEDDLENIISNMQEKYNEEDRGIELIKVDNSYQLCTKKELYEYLKYINK